MEVAALADRRSGETRVAITPETAQSLARLGFEVSIESGAGLAAGFDDSEYERVGAGTHKDHEQLLASADVTLVVGRPSEEALSSLKAGSVLVGLLEPFQAPEFAAELARRQVSSFAVELIPRLSRTQSMDALSSQTSIAGYRAVLNAAARCHKLFPMMTTAAGTITPARVLVVGAGVAGLQAIATAVRLGARVSAYDTRPVVREQIESLGAQFIDLELDISEGEGKGGYAKEQGDEFLKQQRSALAEHIANADVVITTAAIPGRPAPRLISADAVSNMRPGSVIVDLAAAGGGNCDLTQANRETNAGGVLVLGPLQLPCEAPADASRMYSRNLTQFLTHLTEDGGITIDLEDEITAGCLLTHGGEIVRPEIREMLKEEKA